MEISVTNGNRKSVWLQELVYFESNPDISRAIFVCAPNRGSALSDGPLGRLGNFLIKQSFEGFAEIGGSLAGHPSELDDTILFHPTNGIDYLLAHSEILETVVKLPIRDGITFHSIVGDRGKGSELETSSDGIVEYWSSSLDGAESEFVAGTSHTGATGDDGSVNEIRRILYLHVGEPFAL